MGGAASCGSVHGKTALSLFSTTISVLLCFSTTLLNACIVLAIAKNKKKSMSGLFYSILLNISFGDLLTGLLTDVASAVFHLKEALAVSMPPFEIKFLHMSLFIINGASVLSMALLSLDRMYAIIFPFQYRDGIGKWKRRSAIASTWILSILITLVYLKIGYIKHLAVFASTTVTLALILMVATFWLYHSKLIRRPIKPSTSVVHFQDQVAMNVVALSVSKNSKRPIPLSPREPKVTIRSTGISERRVTMSFIIMLFVFAISYLPTCVMIIYMNSCSDCDCILIHALRDLTFLFILSSALLRAVNFFLRLSPIRRSVASLIYGNHRSGNETSVSHPN